LVTKGRKKMMRDRKGKEQGRKCKGKSGNKRDKRWKQ
jgi:hypothetical protein